MPTKKKTKKGGSAANRNRMKAVMAKAKKIRAAHPTKKWTTCVKEAWKK